MNQKVDLNPTAFSEGGGLADDFDGLISDIRFIMTDYDGAAPEAVPVCKIIFDIEGEAEYQLYSVGGSGDFAPDETGMGLIKLRTKDTLTKKSKFGMFLDSLVKSGVPTTKMDSDDISYLVGLSGHFLRSAVEYKGLKKKNDRDDSVLLCTKVHTLPWDAVKGSKGKSKGKGAAGKVDDVMADTTANFIQDALIDLNGEAAKKDILSALFKVEMGSERNAVLKLAKNDTFLKTREEWTFEDGVLKMV